jgi:hypothetical protein
MKLRIVYLMDVLIVNFRLRAAPKLGADWAY